MNDERTPRRSEGLRWLFFAAAILVVIGAAFAARSTDTTLVPYGPETVFAGYQPPANCDPNEHAFACMPIAPVVRPGGTTVMREAHYRVAVVFGGAAVALVLVGFGLALDRR